MWTNETKLIYSVERWPHNVTTTATAICHNASYINWMYQMMAMNKKWRNEEKDDDEPYELLKNKNEGGSSREIYMSRRLSTRSLFCCNRRSKSTASPICEEKERSNSRPTYARHVSTDWFCRTLCCYCVAFMPSFLFFFFFANWIFASCSPLFHSILFLFIFVPDFWVDNHNSIQRSNRNGRTNIVDFDCNICMRRNSIAPWCYAMRFKSQLIHHRRNELSQA